MNQVLNSGKQVEDTFKRFGSLINFSVLLVGFFGLFVGLGEWKSTVETDISGLKTWQDNHTNYHRERLAETKEIQGQVSARLNELSKNEAADGRLIDSLTQRVSVLEKSIDTVEINASRTTEALSKLSGDMQVVKEILTRIEKQRPR
jgi:hypothetical protein